MPPKKKPEGSSDAAALDAKKMIEETIKAQSKLPSNRAYTLVKGPNGELDRVDKISEHWVKGLYFLPFFPMDNRVQASVEIEKERDDALEVIAEDLSTLLKMKFHIFWSHMIHDKSVTKFLDTYLEHRARRHDDSGGCISFTALDQTISKRVLLVLLRMASYQEDQENYLERDAHGAYLYDNWLFDVPKLFDIATVFGGVNEGLCSRIIGSVFHAQPNYYQDLENAIATMVGCIDEAVTKIEVDNNEERIRDAAIFILDSAVSLHSFIRAHPPISPCFLSQHFNKFLATTYSRLSEASPALHDTVSDVQYKLLKSSILDSVNLLVENGFFSQIEKGKGAKKATALEGLLEFVGFLGGANSDKKLYSAFTRDVLFRHKWSDRIRALEMEETARRTLLSTLQKFTAKLAKKTPSAAVSATAASAAANRSSAVEQVLEVFPHLTASFVQVCLDHFGNNAERVMDLLLTDSLPTPLQQLRDNAESGRTSPSATSKAKKEPAPKAETGKSKKAPPAPSSAGAGLALPNIFAGDDFDIDSGRVDTSRVYIKGRPEAFSHVLADAAETAEVREKIKQWEEWGGYAPPPPDEEEGDGTYEDEFDDSYEDFVRFGFVEGECESSPSNSDDDDTPKPIRPTAPSGSEQQQKRVIEGQTRAAQLKDRNKAARGNHNRRKQHDKKMRGGMFGV